MTEATKHYDLEGVYDAEIAPLMTKIIEICEREKMPMVASFAYRAHESGTDRCTSHLHWPERREQDYHDAVRIIRHHGAPGLAMTIVSAPKVSP